VSRLPIFLGECEIVSHKTSKVAIENHTLYVKVKKGKGGSQCRLTPSLPANRLPGDKLINSVLAAEHTATVWACLFSEWLVIEEKTGSKELGDGSKMSSWEQIDRTEVGEWESA
jgi:hypothetical protein